MDDILHFFVRPAEVTEGALLRDLIFVFQNIDGQYIQFDSHKDTFRISSKVCCWLVPTFSS